MTRAQIYLHGVMVLLLGWNGPVENCFAASLRPSHEDSLRALELEDPYDESFRMKKDKLVDEFICTDESPIFSTERCLENVFKVDKHPIDRRLSRGEFMEFIALQTHGIISPKSFSRLPMSLIMYFNQKACECNTLSGSPEDCCIGDNAYVPLEFDASGICNRLGSVLLQACQIVRRSSSI